LAALLILLCAGAAPVGADPQVCDERCVLIRTTVVKESIFSPKVALTGGIEPKFSSDIAFRVSGKISQRLVEIGDHVSADQVMARLDPQEQQATLDTAIAGLASAEALLAQAKTNFVRQQALYQQGYTTRSVYDQAQQQLRTQTAAVESAKAALGNAQTELGYTALKPGVAGIVTGRSAEVGQVVQAGQTIFTIAQDGPRDAVFDLYEALLTGPPTRYRVKVYLQADPRVATEGTVREVSPSVDSASGTVRVKVGLDSVPPGMSLGAAVVGVGELKSHKAIVLPRSALYRWQDQPAVWIYDPATGKVTPRVVTLERFFSDKLILTGGVTAGEQVVTAGLQFLYPGQIVGLATEPAP
jgi:RND family efflux transporter MFP subunit